jgi:hypothetical protein
MLDCCRREVDGKGREINMVVAVADLRSKDWRGLDLVLHVSERSTASPSDWMKRSEAPRGTYSTQYELSSTVGVLGSLRVTSFLTHLARFWEASFQLDRSRVFQGRNSFNLIGVLSVSNPVSRLTLRRSLADEMPTGQSRDPKLVISAFFRGTARLRHPRHFTCDP